MLERVAILGLGLIGGSIGAALRASGADVTGYDVTAETRNRALARGLVDHVVDNPHEALRDVDVAVLAMPVREVIQALRTLSFEPGTLVLDTGSTKRAIVEEMNVLPDAVYAVGGHPIAGKELSGPDAADAWLFRGRTFVLTPTHRTDDRMDVAKTVVEALSATPVVMDAEEHDRLVAMTSHLPQMLSCALALALEGHDVRLAGTGLLGMTRLAGSDPAMWTDIAMTNDAQILVALDEMRGALDDLTRTIGAGDADSLFTLLRRARSVALEVKERVAA